MRKYLPVLLFLFNVSFAFTQEYCHDIIFAVDGNRIILECCIKKVIGGNIVVYSRDVRAANNKNAMDKIKAQKSLSFGANIYGVGFTYRF